MNPIYKFELSKTGVAQEAFPVYKDDLSINYQRQSGEEFYRARLSGRLTFQKDDYLFIRNSTFSTQFTLTISISYDLGVTWSSYFVGQFWKTDCEFNEDDQTVVVTPTLKDQYNPVLAGLDKEYNLIELAPVIIETWAYKRPMIQIYTPGQDVIACFLSGMWWEQECTPEDNEATLTSNMHFGVCGSHRVVQLHGVTIPYIPDTYEGEIPQTESFTFENSGYRFVYSATAQQEGWKLRWAVERVIDGYTYWQTEEIANNLPTLPYDVTLEPEGATGEVLATIGDVGIYGRVVCDVDFIDGNETYPINPETDLVPNNRNYHRVIPFTDSSLIVYTSNKTNTPTKWGLYQPGEYYLPPYTLEGREFFPISRKSWGTFSVWFQFSGVDWLYEESGRALLKMPYTYPLHSVISVLLGKISPGITHSNTTAYSEFLYSNTNPITGINQRLAITPKSNVVTADYDQPAQKAMITLRDVLNMLRDCFRCYWFIDSSNRFRIEHISYFMNGGAYPGTPGFPEIGVKLTEQIVTRNGKPWSYARNQYRFDKPAMAARYQFGWMDDVTELFDGYPIDILSPYVEQDNIEEINVAKFTSDIDYVMLNPSAVSKDGFVLLSGTPSSNQLIIPFYDFVIHGVSHILQNPYVSFQFLQEYYDYDMPARNYEINGVFHVATGVKRLKLQSIRFPALYDPDLSKLIKTEIGSGEIEEISINLSSRNATATLRYDTE